MKTNVRPLEAKTDDHWALKENTRYFELQPRVGTADGDRFDVLATLIEAYEEKHWLVEPRD